MTGFHTYHSYSFLNQRNTKILSGTPYQTVGASSLRMLTSTEGILLSLAAHPLAFLPLWIGRNQDGIQTIGNIVKHTTPVGLRVNCDETGSTTFYVLECKNFWCSQNTRWRWGLCENFICLDIIILFIFLKLSSCH
jgi:hypothetical protein